MCNYWRKEEEKKLTEVGYDWEMKKKKGYHG